jgi:hypothetical protein
VTYTREILPDLPQHRAWDGRERTTLNSHSRDDMPCSSYVASPPRESPARTPSPEVQQHSYHPCAYGRRVAVGRAFVREPSRLLGRPALPTARGMRSQHESGGLCSSVHPSQNERRQPEQGLLSCAAELFKAETELDHERLKKFGFDPGSINAVCPPNRGRADLVGGR